jgi:hypothetical protein
MKICNFKKLNFVLLPQDKKLLKSGRVLPKQDKITFKAGHNQSRTKICIKRGKILRSLSIKIY